LWLGITDPGLAEIVVNLYADEWLVRVTEEPPTLEPIIVCLMGLISTNNANGRE